MNEPTKRSRIITILGISVVALVLATGLLSIKDELGPLGARLLAAVLPSTLFALANQDRAAAGVSTLTENALLDKAAQMKADDMAAKGYYAHITPTGETPLSFLNKVGYRYTNVGENLGLNYDDAQSVETAWLNSPKHKEALLLSQFTEIGIGVSNGTYQGMPATFVVALFATPLPSTPTTVATKLVTTPPAAPIVPKSTQSTAATKAARIQEINSALVILQDAINRLTTELKTLK